MAQIYGFLEKAQFENVSSDLSNTLAGLVWFNTTDSRSRFYDGSAVRTVVDENSTQTLINKILTGNQIASFSPDGVETITCPVVTGTLTVNDAVQTLSSKTLLDPTISASIIFDELGSTPSTPSSGQNKVYFKDDGLPYYLNDQGDEVPFGGAGGGLDVFLAEDFEVTDASNFVTGNAANPDNAGSGAINGTLADEDASPISKGSSIKYTMGGASANDFFLSPSIDLDTKQIENTIKASFYSQYNGDDNDLKFIVIDQADNVLSSELDFIKASDKAQRFEVGVYIPSTVTSIRYGFQVVTGNSGKVFTFDDVELSTNPFIYKNMIETTSVSISNNVLVSNPLRVDLSSPTYTNSNSDDVSNSLFTMLDTGSRLEITALKEIDTVITLDGFNTTANTIGYLYVDGVIVATTSQLSHGLRNQIVTWSGKLAPGSIVSGGGSWQTSNNIRISVSAQAQTEHVVTPATSNITTIEGKGNGGTSITVGTTNVDFTETVDAAGAWDGTTYTIQKSDSIVQISGNMLFTTTAIRGIDLFKNGSSYKRLNTTPNSLATIDFNFTSYKGEFSKDDTLTLRMSDNGGTLSNNTAIHWVSITESGDAQFLAAVPVQQVAYLKEVQPNGTGSNGGGSFTSGTYHTRYLNTLEGANFVSLSSDQFTLPAGQYIIEALAPAYSGASLQIRQHKARLYNITDSAVEIMGSNEIVQIGGGNQVIMTSSEVKGVITIDSSKTFEIQHRCHTSGGSFGLASSFGDDEIYTQVKITKLR